MESIPSKINRIAATVVDNIPSSGWENFSVTVFALNKMISMKAVYAQNQQKNMSFNPEANGTDIMMQSKSLREMMYNQYPNNCACYAAI